MQRSIQHYNAQVKLALTERENFKPDLDPSKMKWDRPQKKNVTSGKQITGAAPNKLTRSLYRPFFAQFLYFDRFWNNCVYQMPSIFPTNETKNLLICSSGVGSKEYSCLMTDRIADLQLNFNGQCFPRWLPGKKPDFTEDMLNLGEKEGVPSGFSSEALPHFQAAYPGKSISEDDLFITFMESCIRKITGLVTPTI